MNTQSFSAEDYKRALISVTLTKNEKKMLQVHYSALDRTLSILDLSRQAGYDHINGFNSVYGHLAKKIAHSLDPRPFDYYVEYLCSFSRIESGLLVTMNEEFARALKELG